MKKEGMKRHSDSNRDSKGSDRGGVLIREKVDNKCISRPLEEGWRETRGGKGVSEIGKG